MIEDRDLRQRDLIDPDKLAETKVTVIGVGAIGRQVAIQLSAIGVSEIHLCDPDTVDAVNLAPQGFLESDLGRPKVDAVSDSCRQNNSGIEITTAKMRFASHQFGGGVIFCCVDSVAAREKIFKATQKRADLFVDGRMSAEYMRVLNVYDAVSAEYYESTLFPQAEMHQDRCTAKATIYCANVAAGIMVSQFVKWLRGCPMDKEVSLNLLANEIGVV